MSLLPPKKHINIAYNSQWLGGIGSGSWFTLSSFNDLYKIERFSDKGILECEGIFEVDNSNFCIKEDYKFTYLSHCRLCTILQNNIKYKFKRYENNNV